MHFLPHEPLLVIPHKRKISHLGYPYTAARMSGYLKTVLLIGATSGIGEELARQYHAEGKKVIIAGRRVERLNQMKSELPGLEGTQVSQTVVFPA